MKKSHFLCTIISLLIFSAIPFAQPVKTYTYESAPNDPLNARIYTLDNGLKIYLSVYKDAPRIQTYIATKAGSKNDPSDATGLAHYLEHMLFKGTDKFGSKEPSKEIELVSKIEDLYEVYRKTTDQDKRKSIYKNIDSLSLIASRYAIANEYDKMLSAIGATGTNAYTSLEQTVYVNEIPSNQIEKWLEIEGERFRNPILRLFHTELEAVYEEKNRGLDNDGRKKWEALYAGLWQKHTYGTQTTIGTIDHLKNPSMKKIREYFNTYYVPNNMAICLSGDLDPDKTVALIDKYMGNWKRKDVPKFVAAIEDPISAPITKEVWGPETESVALAFRFPGSDSKDAELLEMMSSILMNGQAGLIDLNLNQKQKVLGAYSGEMINKDYSAHVLGGNPKQGQTLDEVKELLLSQIELVKKGEFSDWLLPAIINNKKLELIRYYESNTGRANAFVDAFIKEQDWAHYIGSIDRLSKITKQEIIDFAKKNYSNNYVLVYKLTGEDKNVQKVDKPSITPVEVNRNDQSDFVKKIIETPVSPIEPVFVDYDKDIVKGKLKNNTPLLYNKNNENKLFSLYYVLDMGNNHNKKMGMATDYLEYLGTSKLSPEQVKQEFYKLACTYGVYSSDDKIYVSLSGLNDNMEKALELFESLLNDAQPNEEALRNMIGDILKQRADAKLNKKVIQRAMANYGMYGPTSSFTNILSETELKALKPGELIELVKSISTYQHRVLYYGPRNTDEIITVLNSLHKTPAQLKPLPIETKFVEQATGRTVYIVDYDMKQAEITLMSKSNKYNKEEIPVIELFNGYFGGGMSSIVFQEMRESKALAYSVYATYRQPSNPEKSNYVYAYIGTQADKLPEAMKGMIELMNNMPEAEITFTSTKESIIQNLRTQRTTKSDILFNYEYAKKMGHEHDINKDVFAKVPSMTFADIKAFQEKNFKNKDFTVLVLGKKDGLDNETLKKYGEIKYLTLEDIFGY